MAYPYQIATGDVTMPDPFYTPGPYYNSGNLYVTLMSNAASTANDFIRIYKSSDAGITWAEADSANHPLYYQSDTRSPIDTYRRGNILYVSYIPQGGIVSDTNIVIRPFDMNTDTWGSPVTSLGPKPFDNKRFKSFVLSTGDIRTVYVDDNGSGQKRVSVATYSGGSWGSPTVMFNPGVDRGVSSDFTIHGAVLDPLDNIGVSGQYALSAGTFTNQCYRAYSAAGSLGTFITGGTTVAFKYFSDTLSGTPCTVVNEAGAYSPVFPSVFELTSGSIATPPPIYSSYPGVIRVDPGNSPISARAEWLNDIMSLDATPNAFPHPSTFFDSATNVLYLYWSDNGGVSANPQVVIKRSDSRGLGWSSPTTIFSSGSGGTQAINFISLQQLTSTTVGFVFDAASNNPTFAYYNPWYFQETIPTATSPECICGTDFSNMNLAGFNFSNSNFTGANLTGATGLPATSSVEIPLTADLPFPPVWPYTWNTGLIYGREHLGSNIKMIRGDSYTFNDTVILSGNFQDITGGTIIMTAKYEIEDDNVDAAFQKTSSPANGITLTDPTNGVFQVQLDPDDTNVLPLHTMNLFYDIQYTDAAGNVYTINYGILTILPDITSIPPP